MTKRRHERTRPALDPKRAFVRLVWPGLALLGVSAVAVLLAWPPLRRAAGHGSSAPPPLNILLITLDTTRADRIGAYGYAAARTSHLDRLAAEGVRFERTIAPAPITLPSHASLFTGRFPF